MHPDPPADAWAKLWQVSIQFKPQCAAQPSCNMPNVKPIGQNVRFGEMQCRPALGTDCEESPGRVVNDLVRRTAIAGSNTRIRMYAPPVAQEKRPDDRELIAEPRLPFGFDGREIIDVV